MPTIQEIRKQYPQYSDMSDEALATALHRKFYSDMPEADFRSKIGMPAPGTMPDVDPMGTPTGTQSPVGAPPVAPPGRDRQGNALPEEPFTFSGAASNLLGGVNDYIGHTVSLGPRMAEYAGNALIRGAHSGLSALTDALPDGPFKQKMQGQIPEQPPQMTGASDAERAFHDATTGSAPVNGWERGFRRGGEVAASTLPFIFAPEAAAVSGFGRTAAGQANDMASAATQALKQNPAAFRAGSAEAVPGMGAVEAAKQVPQLMVDAAAAHPTALPALDLGASVGSGMGEELGAEHAENQQAGATIGSILGGALPTAYSFVSPLMLGARLAGKALNYGKHMLPESATFADRQAERNAYLNREGKYADPNVPAPKEEGMWKNGSLLEGNLPTPSSWYTKQQDLAGQARQDYARDTVGQAIQREISHPDAQAAGARTDELEQAIPGYKAGLAQRYESAPLLKKQQEIDEKLTGSELTEARARRDANAAAIREKADSTVPKIGPAEGPPTGPRGYQDPDIATGNAAAANVTARDLPLAQNAAEAEHTIRKTTEDLPKVPPQQSGAQIRQGYDQGREAANTQVEANKRAIIDEAGPTRFSGQALNEGLKSDLAGMGSALAPDEMTPAVRRVIQATETGETPKTGPEALLPRAAPAAPEFSAQDLLEARKDVNEQLQRLRSGQVTTSDGAKIQRLTALKSRLDAEWGNLGGEGSNVKGAVDEFNRHYREDVAPNYRQGLGGDLGETTPRGEPKVPNSEVPGRILNSPEDAAQNARVNKPGTPARNATVEAALNDYRKTLGTGQVTAENMTAWVNRHQGVLAEDPEIAAAFKKRDPKAMEDIIRRNQSERDALAETKLGKIAETMRPGAKGNVSDLIDEAIGNPTAMRQLKAEAAKDPDVDAALKRAAWERILAKGKPASVKDTVPNGAAMSDYAGKNAQSLNILYGEDSSHLRDLQAIVDAARKESLLPRPAGKAEETQSLDEKVKSLTGASIASFLQKFRNTAAGRVSPTYTAADVIAGVTNKANQKQIDRAWKEALTNPDMAKILAAGVRNKGFTPMMEKKISSYLLLAPETQTKGVEEDDKRGK